MPTNGCIALVLQDLRATQATDVQTFVLDYDIAHVDIRRDDAGRAVGYRIHTMSHEVAFSAGNHEFVVRGVVIEPARGLAHLVTGDQTAGGVNHDEFTRAT